MRALSKLASAFCGCALVGGCATLPQDVRLPLTLPPGMTAVYSEVNVQLMLVTRPDAPNRCSGPACSQWDDIEQRIARIGPDLAKAAYRLYPDIGKRVRNFEFIVADKSEPGTVSTSSGRIIVLRPVGSIAPGDAALAFVLAREIGHIVANHHEENVAATLLVSGLVHLLAPVANLPRALGNLFVAGGATTTTTTGASATVAANAAVSATSFMGSRVLITSYKPRQREEADLIAIALLAQLGYDAPSVLAAIAREELRSPETEWMSGLRASLEQLSTPATRAVVLEAKPGTP